jgi:hypothetical protein
VYWLKQRNHNVKNNKNYITHQHLYSDLSPSAKRFFICLLYMTFSKDFK